jgi:transketolase
MASLDKNGVRKYENLAKEIRNEVLNMIYRARAPHIGCSFSMIELLVALYFKTLKIDYKNPENSKRDRFILSKGHGVHTLYAVLAKKGFISPGGLKNYGRDGNNLEFHPNRDLKMGVEITSGSLGHGLSVGAGMALSGKRDKMPYRVFVYLGDGELNEGSNWEAIMFAAQHKLDNLVAIVDHNKLQAMGRSEKIINMSPLKSKWDSFGWATKEVDGHDFYAIFKALEKIPFSSGKPNCLIAHTVKGKGVSFMENALEWHDKCPNEAEYKAALAEINSKVK